MAWYRTGTIALTNGSALVNGTGTAWVANALPGDILSVPGAVLEVKRIVSDTQLELVLPYGGATAAGVSYALVPTQGYVPTALQTMQQILSEFGDIWQAWHAGDLQGRGLVLKGAVAAVSDLPAEGNTAGDGYIVAGSSLHVWNGTAWAYAGEMVSTPELLALQADVRERAELVAAGVSTAQDAATRAESSATVSLATINIQPDLATGAASVAEEGVCTILAGGPDGLKRTTTFVKRSGTLVPVLDPLSGAEFDSLIRQRPGGAASNFVAADGTSIAGVTRDSFHARAFDVGGKLDGERLQKSKDPIDVRARDGSSAFKVRASGVVDAPSLRSVRALIGGTEASRGRSTVRPWGIGARDNTIGFLIGRDGARFGRANIDRMSARVARVRRLDQSIARAFPAEICHIIMYGQSLSRGERALVNGTTVLSTSQRFDSLMFVSGTQPDVYGDAAPYASFVPLIESARAGINQDLAGIANPGETPLSGCCDQIKAALLADGIAPADYPFQLLGSCAGRGGTALDGLADGTAPFARVLAQVTAAKALADAASKSYRVLAVPWLQGESGPYARNVYAIGLQQVLTALNTQIKAITGQAEDVLFPLYQTSGTSNVAAALAQADVADALANAFVAAPVYPLQTVLAPWFDGVHLSAAASRLIGAYIGRSLKQWALDGAGTNGLRATAVTLLSPRLIGVDLAVPGSRAVIDRSDTATGNPHRAAAGFELMSAGSVGIADVYMASPRRIHIRTTGDVPSGAYLLYGRIGGNVRDDSGDLDVAEVLGAHVPLDHYMQVFDHTFA
ncbi:hypothetical protein [Pseudacidovorax sp. RU35E]|uniref:hypothetical protein n=1 Tax=Pseudacidovorax sp. RU35E TaxID=1907403 RepID=UPI000955D725|nr:hypothetical protein [Pseudacidovorax sp. RU35E]SIR06932.1 hypothetical protein SAMN05880557_107306 [Pseudacidovorax sp. RU35E]